MRIWLTNGDDSPRESPVLFHWDGLALWMIGGVTFPKNLKRDPRCAIGIVDWNPATGFSQHVGLRGRAEVLPFDGDGSDNLSQLFWSR